MTLNDLEQVLNNLSSQPMMMYGDVGVMVSNMLAVLNEIQTLNHILKSDGVNDAYKMNMASKVAEMENIFIMSCNQRLMERGLSMGMSPMMPSQGMQMGGMYSPMQNPMMMNQQMMGQQMAYPQQQFVQQPMQQMPPVQQQPMPAPEQQAAPAPAPAAPTPAPATAPASDSKGSSGGGAFMGMGSGGGGGPSGPAAGRDYLLKLLEK